MNDTVYEWAAIEYNRGFQLDRFRFTEEEAEFFDVQQIIPLGEYPAITSAVILQLLAETDIPEDSTDGLV